MGQLHSEGRRPHTAGPLFKRLGIKVVEKFDPHPAVMRDIRTSDKYAATVWVTAKPVAGIAQADWPAGFKLISVPYTKELEELYLPATLDGKDYPKLIAAGQKIETIAVPAVLAVYNWQPGSARHARMVASWTVCSRGPPNFRTAVPSRWKDVILRLRPGGALWPAQNKPTSSVGCGQSLLAADRARYRLVERRMQCRPLRQDLPLVRPCKLHVYREAVPHALKCDLTATPQPSPATSVEVAHPPSRARMPRCDVVAGRQ